MLAINEDCYCGEIQDAKLFASVPILLIISVDRADENLTVVSTSDFAEHLVHDYVIPIPRRVKMEHRDVVATDDVSKLIGQDFGC